jgi:hypothetical protein
MSPVWEDSKLFKHALAQQVIRFCVNPSWLCLHARFPRPSTCLIRLQLSFLLPYCDILWFGATTKTWALLMRQSLENPQLIWVQAPWVQRWWNRRILGSYSTSVSCVRTVRAVVEVFFWDFKLFIFASTMNEALVVLTDLRYKHQRCPAPRPLWACIFCWSFRGCPNCKKEIESLQERFCDFWSLDWANELSKSSFYLHFILISSSYLWNICVFVFETYMRIHKQMSLCKYLNAHIVGHRSCAFAFAAQ